MKLRKSVMFPTHKLAEPSAIEHLKRVLKKDCGEEIINTIESEGGFHFYMDHPADCDSMVDTRLTATADFAVLDDSRAVSHLADIAPTSYMHSKYEDEINDLKKQLEAALKRIELLENIILREYSTQTDYK